MKKLCIILITILVASNAIANELKKVFISQVIEHPALDITTKGIIDGLEKNGFKRGQNLELRIESAQANAVLAAQIAAKFISQNPDIVVGVGTLSTLSFVKYAKEEKIKLAFSTVTDPLVANIVDSLEKPGNNTSGASNLVGFEPQLTLFQKLQPNLTKLGIIYNSSELNSISIIRRLKAICPKLGLTLVKQIANKTSDVGQATAKLASKVDAIFISNDNTALAALSSIIKIANKAKIPVYTSDTDSVELGALAALGPNQYAVGMQTGTMVARALKGENLGNMPVEFPNKTDLYINEIAANELGIIIPDDVKVQASKIINKCESLCQ